MLKINIKLLTLSSTFASLYAILQFLPLFPVFGAPGRFITAGNIIAPIIGLALGPIIGALSTLIGGLVSCLITGYGTFGPLSPLPAVSSSLYAGLIKYKKLELCIIFYIIGLIVFAFYPNVGPIWIFPFFIWMHIIGLVLTILMRKFLKSFDLNKPERQIKWIITLMVSSTLFGHLTGCFLFELMYYPAIINSIKSWKLLWETLTFIYPIERLIIASLASIICLPVLKILKATRFH